MHCCFFFWFHAGFYKQDCLTSKQHCQTYGTCKRNDFHFCTPFQEQTIYFHGILYFRLFNPHSHVYHRVSCLLQTVYFFTLLYNIPCLCLWNYCVMNVINTNCFDLQAYNKPHCALNQSIFPYIPVLILVWCDIEGWCKARGV